MSHCTGYSTVPIAWRTGPVIWKRVSATMRNKARALKAAKRDKAEGPCLNNGGRTAL